MPGGAKFGRTGGSPRAPVSDWDRGRDPGRDTAMLTNGVLRMQDGPGAGSAQVAVARAIASESSRSASGRAAWFEATHRTCTVTGIIDHSTNLYYLIGVNYYITYWTPRTSHAYGFPLSTTRAPLQGLSR